jgi:hypothetical protein
MNEEIDKLREEVARLRRDMNHVLSLLDQDDDAPDYPRPEYPSFEGKQVSVRSHKMRIPFTVHATETGVDLCLSDKNHCTRLLLSIGENAACLELRNAQGKVIAALSEAADGSGQFAIFDKDGQPRSSMRVSDFGGVVNVVDPKGRPLSVMTASQHGGEIFVANDHRNMAVKITASERGGMVVVHEPSGQVMGFLMADGNTGSCTIYGPLGNPAAGMIANDQGGGIVFSDAEGNNKGLLP